VYRSDIGFVLLIWVILSVYTHINSFSYLVTGVSYVVDLERRLNLNDSMLNFFHFFWTTFTYLPTFFLVIFVITFLVTNTQFKPYQLIIVLCFSIFNYFEVLELLMSNVSDLAPSKLKPQFNLLLTNTLNKYHPFILYISIISILKLSNLYHIVKTTKHLFLKPSVLIQYSNTTVYYVTINLLALFLGGWWALQEGTWGGWWAWESSEVLGLLVTIYGLSTLHLTVSPSYLTQSLVRVTIFYFVLILSYLLIQLSFEIVAHNFGEKSSTNLSLESSYLKYIFIVVFTLTVLLTNVILRRTPLFLFLTSRNLTSKQHKLSTYGWILLFVGVVCFLVVSSFAPIWQHFLWNYFGISKDDYTVNLAIFIIQCGIILTFTLYNRTSLSWWCLALALSLSLQTSLFSLLLITIINTTSLSLLHLTLLFLYTVDIASYDFYFVQVFQKSCFMNFVYSSDFLFNIQCSYSCDYLFITKTSSTYNNSDLSSLAWNFFHLSNKCSTDAYLLQFNSSSLYSLFRIGGLYLHQLLYVEYNILNNFVNTLLIFIYFFYQWICCSIPVYRRVY